MKAQVLFEWTCQSPKGNQSFLERLEMSVTCPHLLALERIYREQCQNIPQIQVAFKKTEAVAVAKGASIKS